PADWRRYIDYVGASSPDNPVPSNIRTGSYLYFADKNGILLPTLYRNERGGQSIYPPDIKALLFDEGSALTKREIQQIKDQYGLPPGYGGMGQTNWITLADQIRSGQGMNPLQNPKPPSFSENLMGNYMPLTADRHNVRLVAPGTPDAPGLAYPFLEQI